MAELITVGHESSPYEVHLVETLAGLGAAIRALGLRRAVVVTEDRVGPLWLAATVAALADGVEVIGEIVLEAGEDRKDLDQWRSLVDALLGVPVDRKTAVIALGGGVPGDLVGFAAASVMRGVPWVLVPTTLLAMVDSSVGGKTAVNHSLGKNLVGAFYPPRLVWSAREVLATLPLRERRAGLVEAYKAGLIGDPDLVALMATHGEGLQQVDSAIHSEVVARAVRVKASVVAQDPQERGLRAVLNLGHTFAHALERSLGFGVLVHGEAVAVGLVVETLFGERRGWTEAGLGDRVARDLQRLGLETRAPTTPSGAMRAAVRLDKKGDGDTLMVPILSRIGAVGLVALPWTQVDELVEDTA